MLAGVLSKHRVRAVTGPPAQDSPAGTTDDPVAALDLAEVPAVFVGLALAHFSEHQRYVMERLWAFALGGEAPCSSSDGRIWREADRLAHAPSENSAPCRSGRRAGARESVKNSGLPPSRVRSR